MTLRRRLLLGTAIIGGGVFGFQPFLRTRMESRLSELLGARVEIGDSKVSLVDGTISFRNLIVRSNNSIENTPGEPSKKIVSTIPLAAIHFDWKSLLYRNFKIDSLAASEIEWSLNDPTQRQIPIANELLGVPVLSPTTGSDVNSHLVAVVQPIKQRIRDVASKQSRSLLELSKRMESISSKLNAATIKPEAFNVLRENEKKIVEEVKRELPAIKQLMAESRNDFKESEKAIVAMRQTAKTNLLALISDPIDSVTFDLSSAALELARVAVAKEWNRQRPIVAAAIESLSMLNDPRSLHIDEETASQDRTVSRKDEPLPQIPDRFTSVGVGKARGWMRFPHPQTPTRIPFEFQWRNLSSTEYERVRRPTATLILNHLDSDMKSEKWTCTAEKSIPPQSMAAQVQVWSERSTSAGSNSTIRLQHSNHGWSSSLIIPLKNCMECLPSRTDSLAAEFNAADTMTIASQLVGNSSETENGGQSVLINVEGTCVGAIESILARHARSVAEKSRSEAELRGSEQLLVELERIAASWEQVGDEHARNYQGWEKQVVAINQEIELLDAAFRRTSRTTRELLSK